MTQSYITLNYTIGSFEFRLLNQPLTIPNSIGVDSFDYQNSEIGVFRVRTGLVLITCCSHDSGPGLMPVFIY